jgi:chromosome segregation ATPase
MKSLEKRLREEGERLAGMRDERRALELRRVTHEDQLRAIEERLSGIRARILFHEDAIGTLLTRESSVPDDALPNDQPSPARHP